MRFPIEVEGSLIRGAAGSLTPDTDTFDPQRGITWGDENRRRTALVRSLTLDTDTFDPGQGKIAGSLTPDTGPVDPRHGMGWGRMNLERTALVRSLTPGTFGTGPQEFKAACPSGEVTWGQRSPK